VARHAPLLEELMGEGRLSDLSRSGEHLDEAARLADPAQQAREQRPSEACCHLLSILSDSAQIDE